MIPNIFEVTPDPILNFLNLKESDLDDANHLVVVGPNCVGKSFLRKMFTALVPKGCKVLHLSQHGRCSSGVVRAMVYGSEEDESTGYNTSHMLRGAFSSAKKWDSNYIILFDEPEIGLSEEAQYGAGIFIRESILNQDHDLFQGCVIMTHSRHIVRELMPIPGAKFLDMSRQYQTWDEWYHRQINPASLDIIREEGHARFLELGKILSKLQKDK